MRVPVVVTSGNTGDTETRQKTRFLVVLLESLPLASLTWPGEGFSVRPQESASGRFAAGFGISLTRNNLELGLWASPGPTVALALYTRASRPALTGLRPVRL